MVGRATLRPLLSPFTELGVGFYFHFLAPLFILIRLWSHTFVFVMEGILFELLASIGRLEGIHTHTISR